MSQEPVGYPSQVRVLIGSGIEDPDPDLGLYPLQNLWVYPDPCYTLGLLKIHVPQGYPCPSLTVASRRMTTMTTRKRVLAVSLRLELDGEG